MASERGCFAAVAVRIVGSDLIEANQNVREEREEEEEERERETEREEVYKEKDNEH